MLKLYENIKRCRKEAGLTQEELARRIGYTDRSSIAKVEKGAVDLSQSKIKQFADALGTTPSHLMGWDAEPEEVGNLAAQVLLDPDIMNLVQTYMKLSESDQYTVRLMVSSLAEKKKD